MQRDEAYKQRDEAYKQRDEAYKKMLIYKSSGSVDTRLYFIKEKSKK